MHVVIFEVEPKPDGKDRYLEIAGQLRAELEGLDGFISIERFQSLSDDGKMLSLSYWRDAEAINAWRAKPEHRKAQAEGRRDLFANYRIRVAEVLRDYSMSGRDEAPQAPPEETA